MDKKASITSVRFLAFKALRDYSLRLSHMNVLVGPNNCGKSTVLGAFRVLAQALRRARSRKAEWVLGPKGRRPGWHLLDETLPIAAENIHSDYEDIDTVIEFSTTGKGKLCLYFPVSGGCYFFAEQDGAFIRSSGELKRDLPVEIQVVPVLGPVEHQEQLVMEETTRKNLTTTRASRNFRNYWRLYPEGFNEFSQLIARTWPGMEVQRPEVSHDIVLMFCLENRISRELYWAGFGFQVWLQLLTHISRVSAASLLIVDEPEIYLHPDIQRQLLGILRDCGADVLLATHSTEIMSEADPSEILLIDKTKRTAHRLKGIEDVQVALDSVGSVQNITLTRLARNKRLLFVEGESDFRVIRRFARSLGLAELAAGTDLTALESGGFSSWQEVRALASGFEKALGFALHVGAIFDRDYWCEDHIDQILNELRRHLEFSHIHRRKEIENYLLVPAVLERALKKAIQERERRTGETGEYTGDIATLLDLVTRPFRASIQSQYIAKRVDYFRGSHKDSATITAEAISVFEDQWNDVTTRVEIVPGKAVLAALRTEVSERYRVNLTDHEIVTEFTTDELAPDLVELVNGLERYRLVVLCHSADGFNRAALCFR